MTPDQIISAWKESTPQVADAPADPAASIELSDADLGEVDGGSYTADLFCAVTLSISAGTAISQLACGSVMHGTCSGFTYGCCH